MQREQVYGAFLSILGTILLIAYPVAFFAVELSLPSWLHTVSIELPVFVFAVIFLFTIIRIGWNMLTAPPAKPLDEQEIEK